jgi:ribonucleotide monophosphatase NagD (HAD superfamily)
MKDISRIRAKRVFIVDMDGVIYHGNQLLRGAAELVEWMNRIGDRMDTDIVAGACPVLRYNPGRPSPVFLSPKAHP